MSTFIGYVTLQPNLTNGAHLCEVWRIGDDRVWAIMARKSRIDAPGALHHIIVRGIERRSIFIDSQDDQNFLERFGDTVSQSGTRCYAWTLMTNHVHLIKDWYGTHIHSYAASADRICTTVQPAA